MGMTQQFFVLSSNLSERGTKHAFPVNLAQIRSAVPEIFKAQTNNNSSAVAEMGDRGHNRHRPKRGGLLYLFRGELGPRLLHCGLGRGLLPYQVHGVFIHPAV